MNIFKKIAYSLIKKVKILPLDIYAKIHYEYYNDKKLDLTNPIEFNEKIQWLKVYFHPELITKLADKYEVREYVEEKIGLKYLNELIAVYKQVDDVNFDVLPQKFVIKGVHGCGYNLIVNDKSKLNEKKARRLMKKWMRRNYYYRSGLEWVYKNIKPKLICEKYLLQQGKEVIDDYKFFCFNGILKFVQIDVDRHNGHCKYYFDMNWKKLPFRLKSYENEYDGELLPPANFDEMKLLAEKLADKLPFVRVDFYSINDKTIFGEMTFYPSDGSLDFVPDEYNKIIGDYLVLPEITNGQKEITTY